MVCPPSVPVTAEKVATGLEEWVVEEMNWRIGRYFDLGKFLFTASSGILVFYSTALKALGTHGCSKKWLVVCTVLAVVGIVASVVLVWPRNTRIGSRVDALKEFNDAMNRQRAVLLVWTVATVVALAAGLLSLVEIGPSCDVWT